MGLGELQLKAGLKDFCSLEVLAGKSDVDCSADAPGIPALHDLQSVLAALYVCPCYRQALLKCGDVYPGSNDGGDYRVNQGLLGGLGGEHVGPCCPLRPLESAE